MSPRRVTRTSRAEFLCRPLPRRGMFRQGLAAARRRERYDSIMADFLLILRGDANADLSAHSPAQLAELLEEYEQWTTALGDRVLAAEKVWTERARVVRSDGAASEGPHGDAAEVVSGFYIVSADDLEHATQLCSGHPCLRFGSIEVRELQPNPARAQASVSVTTQHSDA